MSVKTITGNFVGEIRHGTDIGYKSKRNYIWHVCVDCGKARWEALVHGNPESIRCYSHNGSKQGFAENNSNWNPSAISRGTGAMRAARWYPKQPCEKCGCLGEHHHKDGNDLNNGQTNIVFLCRKHHMEADGRLDKFLSTCRGLRNRRNYEYNN